MARKLSRVQRETLDALKNSRFGYLEIGPLLLQPRTAEALVARGLCQYDMVSSGRSGDTVGVIRLADSTVCPVCGVDKSKSWPCSCTDGEKIATLVEE